MDVCSGQADGSRPREGLRHGGSDLGRHPGPAQNARQCSYHAGVGGGRGWALVCERGTAADSHISCPPSEGSSASLHLTPQMGWEADEPEYV